MRAHRSSAARIAPALVVAAVALGSVGCTSERGSDEGGAGERPGPVPTTAPISVVTRPLVPAPPGTLIEATPLAGPDDARAWRVVFHSRSADDRDIAVTGLVVAGEATGDGGGAERSRPVVAWGHPTTGSADRCAPSTSGPSQVPIAEAALAEGWTVVAPDFEGLGVEGPHPYLGGESAGRTMLDAVRAAGQIEGAGVTPRSPVLLWGFSQGGQAALFGGEQQPTYAPELDLRGVAAVAPVADPRAFWDRAASRPDQVGVAVVIAAGMAADDPTLDPATVLTEAAVDRLPLVETDCIGDVVEAFTAPVDEVVATPIDAAPDWAAALERNQVGHRPSAAPVLLVQGTADDIVFPEVTESVADRACRHGTAVAHERVQGAGHGDIPPGRVLPWLRARLDGEPAPTTCRGGQPG